MVQHALTPADFRRAIDDYAFGDVPRPELLPRDRLLLIGEAHGLRAGRMPAVLYEIVAAAGARALGFEWSHEELDEPLAELARTGRFPEEALWDLPPPAEALGGDGRLTAGHIALLERLQAEDHLDCVVAFDRLDADPPAPPEERDRDMADRVRRACPAGARMVVVVGAAHALDEPGTMAQQLGVRAAMFDYGAEVAMPSAPRRFQVPKGAPAVVPGR